MSYVVARVLRVPIVVVAIGLILAAATPAAMARYTAFSIRGTAGQCLQRIPGPFGVSTVINCERSLSDQYSRPFFDLMSDAALRSLVLLAGAAVLALVVGSLLGISMALLRRRALASGGIIGLLSLMAAIPSFFLAYFLQITVIVLGASEGGHVLPVFGFGYDEHVVLPLLSISVPAIAYTAQLTATRMQDVLDSDFVTTANAKGLLPSWIIAVHVLPHVRPVLLEALGSGLRVSVASLPIIEYLFGWNGIGALGLQAIASKDGAAFVFAAVVLVAVFAILSAIADLSRPRALYRST